MMYSRADDSRSWPKIVEVRWPRNVNSDWASTTSEDQQRERGDAAAGDVVVDGAVDEVAEQARDRAARWPAANPLSSTIAANAPRRIRTRRRKNANTTSLSATGQPALGAARLRVDALGALLADQVPAVQRAQPLRDRRVRGRGTSSGGMTGGSRAPVAPGVGGVARRSGIARLPLASRPARGRPRGGSRRCPRAGPRGCRRRRRGRRAAARPRRRGAATAATRWPPRWSGRAGARRPARRSAPPCARRRPRWARPAPGSVRPRPGPAPARPAAAGPRTGRGPARRGCPASRRAVRRTRPRRWRSGRPPRRARGSARRAGRWRPGGCRRRAGCRCR